MLQGNSDTKILPTPADYCPLIAQDFYVIKKKTNKYHRKYRKAHPTSKNKIQQ